MKRYCNGVNCLCFLFDLPPFITCKVFWGVSVGPVTIKVLNVACFVSGCCFHLLYVKMILSYSPHNIIWKLPICISPCPETPPTKCNITILLLPKSRKTCHKNFDNRLTNKNFTMTRAFFIKGNPRNFFFSKCSF